MSLLSKFTASYVTPLLVPRYNPATMKVEKDEWHDTNDPTEMIANKATLRYVDVAIAPNEEAQVVAIMKAIGMPRNAGESKKVKGAIRFLRPEKVADGDMNALLALIPDTPKP